MARHSQSTMFDAMMRYAAGERPERIAEAMGVDAATISRWRRDGHPEDWEARRKAVEAEAARKVQDELSERKKGLGKLHFETLDYLHRQVKAKLLRPKPGGDPRVFELNPDLSPSDLQKLARTFDIVQKGQRLVFGQSAYIIEGSGTTGTGEIPDLPAAVIAEIEAALGKVAADPGSPVEEEKDD